jgi:hypothetical protein
MKEKLSVELSRLFFTFPESDVRRQLVRFLADEASRLEAEVARGHLDAACAELVRSARDTKIGAIGLQVRANGQVKFDACTRESDGFLSKRDALADTVPGSAGHTPSEALRALLNHHKKPTPNT